MKKSILIALGMIVLLFLYGYVLSTAGHDHSSHGKRYVVEKQDSHPEHKH